VPTLSKGTLLLAALCAAALAQSTPSAAPAPKLQAYTTSDRSASAGVPSGWKVTNGAQTVIVMTGPQNETIALGNTLVIRNAPFQLGQKPSNGVDLSIPNSDSLNDKYTMAMENGAALAGAPNPQIKITSSTPFQVPPSVGQCERVIASFTDTTGPMTIVSLMCSLPVDQGGTYKMIFKTAKAPPAVAQQEGPVASAVFASYRIPSNMLQAKIAPFYVDPAVAAAETRAILQQTATMNNAVNTQANCFDLTVLRETPQYQLPRSCGGPRPD